MRKLFRVFVFISGFLSLGLASALQPIMAYPADEEGKLLVPIDLANRCQVKAEVTSFVYKHRHEFTEEQILSDLHDDWDNVYSKKSYLPWHSFVDMQRIIRDAYRKDANGEYIRDCCTEEVINEKANLEYQLCLHYTEY